MATSNTHSPVQLRQSKRQFANSQSYLSYELGKAVRSLPPLYTRILAGSLSLVFFSTLAWAIFSKVDEVAPAVGKIVPSNEVQPMRSLTSGLLREIKVRNRQHVNKGDVLVQLDPTMPEAEVDRVTNLIRLDREELNRLEAERTRQTQTGNDLQNQLLAARLQEYRNRYAAAKAEANRQMSTIKAARVQLTSLQSDLSYARTKLQGYQTLVGEGAVPRFDYLDTQNKVVSLQKAIVSQGEQIIQAQQAYQAARENAKRLDAERQSEILTQINKQHQELADLEGKLAQAKEQQKATTVRAAVNGTIYDVQVDKTGASVQSGQELLSIVPDGEALILQADVQNKDIGFVQTGMTAKIKLETAPYQEFGTIPGKVVEVSPNAVHRDKEQGLIYPARIQLNQHSIYVRGRALHLAPGMTATAEIVTRQKSIVSFLLDPIVKNWDQAFSPR